MYVHEMNTCRLVSSICADVCNFFIHWNTHLHQMPNKPSAHHERRQGESKAAKKKLKSRINRNIWGCAMFITSDRRAIWIADIYMVLVSGSGLFVGSFMLFNRLCACMYGCACVRPSVSANV